MKKIQYLLLFFFSCPAIFAQKISIEEYVATYKDIAMKEMVRSGVPASITLAQGILETENGNSALVKKSNNHFGIKCKETWTGPSVSHDDDAPQECFRKYENAVASYVDHSDFLRTRKHYHFLFDLDPLDYKSWAYGLKKAGYATNPKYPMILIKYIETYRLNDYSLMAMGKLPSDQSAIAQTDINNKSLPSTAVISAPTNSKEEIEVVAITPTAPITAELPKSQVKSQEEIVSAVSDIKSQHSTQAEVKKVISTPQVEIRSAMPAYPSGEFKINETRVVYVAEGTSLLSLATTYNLPLQYIYDFNDFTEDKELLDKAQLIYLQRKRRVGAVDYHIITEGETLYDIAQKEGIRMEALLQLNRLSERQLPPIGEKLYLQNPAPESSVAVSVNEDNVKIEEVATASVDEEYEVYVVQAKETLYGISKRFNVSVQELQQWNNLSSADLKEGMELIVSQKDYNAFKGTR